MKRKDENSRGDMYETCLAQLGLLLMVIIAVWSCAMTYHYWG